MYFSVLVLGLIHDAESSISPRSSLAFVRPHTRLLIQSVVNSRAFHEFNDYRSDEVTAGKFCQASSSLLTLPGSPRSFLSSPAPAVDPLELFKDHMGSVKSITESSKSFLTSLSDESRLDDIRRANDFNAAWESTIIAELEDIRRALGELEGLHAADSKRANRLGTKATDGRYEESLAVINAIYALDAESHTLKGKERRDSGDKLTGSKSFSKASWTQLQTDHDEAKEAFAKSKEVIQTGLKTKAQTIFTEHLAMVQTCKEYMLQLTGDLPTYSKESGIQSKALPEEESTFGAKALRLIALLEKKDSEDDAVRYSEFESFINKGDEEQSHVSHLTKLMTTLNILQIRRLGLMDAQTSLETLKKAVSIELATQRATASEKLEAIKSQLSHEDFKKLSKTVYIDSIKLPGVEIVGVPVSDVDHLDTHMQTLAKMVGKDANGEFIPQLNLIVNVLWRLHSHVFAFVDAYTPATDGQAADPLTDRKAGADCLLYGRVDALMRRLKLENVLETEMCPEAFQAKGIEKMKDEKLTQEQLKQELLTREGKSPARHPSIENSDSHTAGDTTEKIENGGEREVENRDDTTGVEAKMNKGSEEKVVQTTGGHTEHNTARVEKRLEKNQQGESQEEESQEEETK